MGAADVTQGTQAFTQRLMQDIEALCGFSRGSATSGERQAAEHLERRLAGMGLEVALEPFRAYPHYYHVYLLHMVLLLVAAAIDARAPWVATAIALLVAVSFWGDMATQFYVLRRVFPRQSSQNVLAKLPGPARPRRRVILTAHYDAAHSGLIFETRGAKRMARLSQRFLGGGPAVMAFAFDVMLLFLVTLPLPAFGWATPPVVALQVLLAAVFLLKAIVMWDIGRHPVVPGANDNASAVAVVLALAEKLRDEPLADTEIWALLPGCEEGIMLGMVAFMEQHAPELDRATTYFLNLDSVGCGDLKYTTGEGFLRVFPYDRELVAIAETLGCEPRFADVASNVVRFGTDAQAPNVRGYKVLNLISLDEDGYPANYHWSTDLPENVDPAAVERAYAFTLAVCQQLDGAVAFARK